MYEPQDGVVEFDNQSFSHIDNEWLETRIGPSVSQSAVLFDMSVHGLLIPSLYLGLTADADA